MAFPRLIAPVALLCALVFGSIPALAQSTKVVELARFSQPLDVSAGIAAMPDGRVFTFGNGAGGFGGINEAIPTGGGYQTVQVYAFTVAGDVPNSTCRNQVCTDAIAPGADGTVYFSGRYLSRFDPASHTVTHLQDFGTDNEARALTLGNDGHTLFGARSDGRVFRFDTAGGTYQELTNVGGDVFGVLQMDNGTLMVTLNQWTTPAAWFIQVDPATGAWANQLAVTPGWSANPTKGDDGQTYVIWWSFSFGQKFSRIDSTCFCPFGALIPDDRSNTALAVRNGFAYYNQTGGVRRRNITTGVVEPVTSTRVDSRMKMAPDGRLLIYVVSNFVGTWRSIDTNALVPGVESSVLIAETSATDGLDPPPLAVTEASNGKLYGVNSYSQSLTASIFEIDPVTHTQSVVATFEHLEHPNRNCCAVAFEPMVAAPNGALYGVYSMDNWRIGRIGSHVFRFDPATGAVGIIHTFDQDVDGANPHTMMLGRDGRMYGLLDRAGTAASYDGGGFFRVDPATDEVTTIFGLQGFYPTWTLTEGSAGRWYGTTAYGSITPDSCVDVYQFDPDALTFTVVKSLRGEEACSAELAMMPDGKLLGTTTWGGPDTGGAIFTLDPMTGVYTLLSAFTDPPPNGYAFPYGPFAGADGYGYVTLTSTADDGAGGLARIDPQTGALTFLFHPATGLYAPASMPGPSGRIYGGFWAPTAIFGIGVLDSIPVAPASGPYAGTTSVSATLKTIGIPLPGRTIAFTLNGHAIGSATTGADGVATLNDVSLSGIAIGSYPAAIVASFDGDDAFPSSTGSGSLTVIDVPTPGLMRGDGFIRDDDMRYDFGFVVRETADGTDRGTFVLKIVDTDTPKHGQKKPRHDRFVSTSYTNVVFSDDPTIRPGRRPRPQVDTVLFSGPGTWDGAAGYRFEVFAQDCGEPGRRRESLRVTIYDSADRIVAQFDDELAGGNVQSIRIMR